MRTEEPIVRKCLECRKTMILKRIETRKKRICGDECSKKRNTRMKKEYLKTNKGKEYGKYYAMLTFVRKNPNHHRDRFFRFLRVAKKMGWVKDA